VVIECDVYYIFVKEGHVTVIGIVEGYEVHYCQEYNHSTAW